MSVLRVGVAGTGHFGRYHALKLAGAERVRLSGVHDRHPERAAAVAAETGVAALSLAGLIEVSDALVVAVPAGAHFDVAAAALRAGRHVLVEKPIAATLAEADELARLAEERGLVLQVGHLERFSAGQSALAGRAGRPLYIEATRVGPFKVRGTDVSVVLDLMIHDLDLVLGLAGSPIEAVEAVGAPVASPLLDMASARIRFASGVVATLAASRVASAVERRMRIFSREGYVSVDFVGRRLRMVRKGAGGRPAEGLPGYGAQEVGWEDHDSLAAEQRAFVASVLDATPVVVDAAAGRRALAAALAVEAAVEAWRGRVGRD